MKINSTVISDTVQYPEQIPWDRLVTSQGTLTPPKLSVLLNSDSHYITVTIERQNASANSYDDDEILFNIICPAACCHNTINHGSDPLKYHNDLKQLSLLQGRLYRGMYPRFSEQNISININKQYWGCTLYIYYFAYNRQYLNASTSQVIRLL